MSRCHSFGCHSNNKKNLFFFIHFYFLCDISPLNRWKDKTCLWFLSVIFFSTSLIFRHTHTQIHIFSFLTSFLFSIFVKNIWITFLERVQSSKDSNMIITYQCAKLKMSTKELKRKIEEKKVNKLKRWSARNANVNHNRW